MYKGLSGVLLVFLITSSPGFAKEEYVNWFICECVEAKIKQTKMEQRQGNDVRNAERLNRRMRKLKKQLYSCRKQGFL